MTKPINKSADIIPIGGKKLAKPEHDIPAFPCHPKTLAKISEISVIRDINVRAEQCVLAGINAEHEEGRTLLESCARGTDYFPDICRLRIETYQSLQSSALSDLQTQFRILITEKLQTRDDDQDFDPDYTEDRLYLLCNFLRNDFTIMPRELSNAFVVYYEDTIEMIVPWSKDESSSYADAALWVRCWLQDPELDDVFLLPNQIT
jgi:hypothetical protein